jgi:uroporphyrinogen III methyltransferase/synthase
MIPRNKLLVIRENDRFSRSMRAGGIEVTNFPLIRTEPLDDQAGLRALMPRLNEYDGLFFTSPAAAQVFGTELAQVPEYRGKVYAMGARSNQVFERRGIQAEFDPSISSADEFIRSLGSELYGKKLLFVRGDQSLQTIPRLLSGKSTVDEVVVYRTVRIQPSTAEIDGVRGQLSAGVYNWTCFFSPSSVDAFCDLFDGKIITKVAAIGQTTSGRAREKGLDVAFVAENPSGREFADAFLLHLNGTHS